MAARPRNGLALCAGLGGLELGLKLALGERYQTVGWVERDAYAAATLVARMAGEALDQAPLWDDLETFDGRPWRGVVDIVTAGFPCQPASCAGRRLGTEDKRWVFDDIARIIAEVQPRWVFLENVPGLLTVRGGSGIRSRAKRITTRDDRIFGCSRDVEGPTVLSAGGAFAEVLGNLAELGFSCEWDCFSAAEVGAPHRRERLFILAHRPGGRQRVGGLFDRVGETWGSDLDGRDSDVGHAGSERRQGEQPAGAAPRAVERGGRADVEGDGGAQRERWLALLGRPFPPGPGAQDEWRDILAQRPDLAPALEPGVRGVADGLADRMDRLRVIGNGVVPLVAATAFLALAARAGIASETVMADAEDV